jgi:DNA-binding MarR family transcriptional regulator
VSHPVNGLDEVVHQRVRLGILAIAQEAKTVDFGFLQTTLELTAGNLSHNLSVLEEAGLVRIQKGYDGKRPRTRVQITADGRRALRSEISHLKQLISAIDSRPSDTTV